MANRQDIEFAIKGTDLASKPLGEIGSAVDKLIEGVNKIVPASEAGERNLSELKGTAGDLKKVLETLLADQTTIDRFTALSTQVGESATKLQGLKTAADAAKAALEGADAKTQALKDANKQAAAAAREGQSEFNKLNKQLSNTTVTAQKAGIDIADLAGAQQKVDAAFAAANPALQKVNATIAAYTVNQEKAKVATEQKAAAEARDAAETEAYNKALAQQRSGAEGAATGFRALAGEVGHAAQSFFSLRGEGRQTLSLFQRLRGEVLETAAEYVGLYGVIEQIKTAFETLEGRERAEQIIKDTFGEGAEEQIKFVREEAEKLGFTYDRLLGEFAKFSASAANSGIGQEKTQETFDALANLAKRYQLTAEQTATLYQGMDKIFAKDQAAAGDLFRRLNTEIPGFAKRLREAFTLDGVSVNPALFNELLKEGKITGETFADLILKVKKGFGDEIPEASKNAASELARFDTALNDIKVAALEGGALDVVKNALKDITAYLKSDEGKQFGERLGTVLTGVAQIVKALADNFNLVVKAAELLFVGYIVTQGAAVLNVLSSMVGTARKLSDAFGIFNSKIPTAAASMKTLSGAIGVASGAALAFTLAFDLGTVLFENSRGVRAFGALMIGTLDLLITTFASASTNLLHALLNPANFKTILDDIGNDIKRKFAEVQEQVRQAYRDEGPSATPAAAAAGTDATKPKETPEERKARETAEASANAKAVSEVITKEFRAVSDKIAEYQAGLLKKQSQTISEYAKALHQQLSPIYQEIETLRNNPAFAGNKEAQDRANQLERQAKAAEALGVEAEKERRLEEQLKLEADQVNQAFKDRADRIAEINKQVEEHQITPERARQQIAAVTASANTAIGDMIKQLQAAIAAAPAGVQRDLQKEVLELATKLKELNARPADDPVKDAEENAKALTAELEKRNAEIQRQQALEKAGLQNSEQTREAVADINKKYAQLNPTIEAYVQFLRTSNSLTADQKKLLEPVAEQLEKIELEARQAQDRLYSVKQAGDDIANGGVKIGDAFAKALGQGKGLSTAFHDAGQAFKKFASDFLLQIGEMILKATLLKAINSTISGTGGGSIASGLSSLVSSAVAHGGGMIGSGALGASRPAMAAWFANAPRYHDGASSVPGLKSDEVPAILQTGEEVLSRGDARNAANGGGQNRTPQHIQVVNAIDHESVVQAGLNTQTGHKTILNIIRANRSAVKQALN